MSTTDPDHYDVLIAGAGLSGIDAAVHLGRTFGDLRYAVLEQRHELGGTWSLFKYPGVRADSDMFTLGYRWKPWTGDSAIAEGADIWAYLADAAREHGVHERIKYRHKVTQLDWSSAERRWTVSVLHPDTSETSTLTCDFFVAATGYFDYEQGYQPQFRGIEDFAGRLVHPQHWPEDLDHSGQRVVVIGSGATAVTLVPALARDAGHVTLLQRTPTYISSRPRIHRAAKLARRMLPRSLSSALLREAHAARAIGEYFWMRRFPEAGRRLVARSAKAQLPTGFDHQRHLSPPYDPWDQRLCIAPDSDLFRALNADNVEIVTDRIERFTENGMLLKSGEEIEADVVVTATGLKVLGLGGARLSIDGEPSPFGSHFAYKAMMLDDVPNFAFLLGYTNASWTLKVDLVCEYLVRLLQYMAAEGHTVVVARPGGPLERRPLSDLTSGYVMRSGGAMPWAGDQDPWQLKQNWYFDRRMIRRSPIADGTLEFS